MLLFTVSTMLFYLKLRNAIQVGKVCLQEWRGKETQRLLICLTYYYIFGVILYNMHVMFGIIVFWCMVVDV